MEAARQTCEALGRLVLGHGPMASGYSFSMKSQGTLKGSFSGVTLGHTRPLSGPETISIVHGGWPPAVWRR